MSVQPDFDPVFSFDLADRLNKTLRETGLSRSFMAEHFGVRLGTISSWTHGHTRPNRSQLRDWALTTKYPLEWLEHGVEPADLLPRLDSNQQPAVYLRPQVRALPVRHLTLVEGVA